MQDQTAVTAQFKVVYNPVYDNSSQTLNDVACSNLITLFPTLGDVPSFPFIGGAPDTSYGSTNCGMCWKITNVESDSSIYFTSIDDTVATDPSLINLSLEAFLILDGSIETGSFGANVETADLSYCATAN